jgi:hypothetical protein
MQRRKGTFDIIVLVIAAVAAPIGSAPAQAGDLGALVPAYFYPGTGGAGGVGDGWAQMASAASQIPVTAIFNPDSGPLPGPPDPNYVTALTNLESAGGTVVAYVYSGYTTVPLATVESQISTYLTQYGGLINGFFVDAMTNDNSPADLAYYHTLYTYIKGLNSSYDVIANPGTSTVPDYLTPATRGADTLLTYEGSAQNYPGSPPPSWVFGYSPNHFANTIYDESSSQGMMNDVTLAVERNVGYVYVTDQTLPNPYSQLPSYWDQEVAAIAAASVPEPSTLSMLASGGLLVAVAATMRRRRRA